ncbi:MAG: monovalent cation/H+ antiporter complex subunit F [Campylobacterota bacterium]|nr:monovalent cation/H+ antiporter complex subunit F [Campylobacterota bacterium]
MFEFFTSFISIAIFLMLYRFLKGPTLSDRVLAFDVIGIVLISFLVILSLYFNSSLYLDIALVLGLISFLGSTIFGRYIEKGI